MWNKLCHFALLCLTCGLSFRCVANTAHVLYTVLACLVGFVGGQTDRMAHRQTPLFAQPLQLLPCGLDLVNTVCLEKVWPNSKLLQPQHAHLQASGGQVILSAFPDAAFITIVEPSLMVRTSILEMSLGVLKSGSTIPSA